MTGKDFDGSGWQRVTGQKARDGRLPSAVSSRAGSRCCSTRRLPASPLARCGAWPSQPGSASPSGVTSPRLLCDTQCAPALLGHRFPACRALLCLLPRTWFLFGCHHSPSSVPTQTGGAHLLPVPEISPKTSLLWKVFPRATLTPIRTPITRF